MKTTRILVFIALVFNVVGCGEMADLDVNQRIQESTYTPEEMLVLMGFMVSIDNAGAGDDPGSAWETCSGGSLDIEICDASLDGECVPPGDDSRDLKKVFKGKGDKACKELGKWVKTALKAVEKGVKKYNKASGDIALWPILEGGKLGRLIQYENCSPRKQADGTIRIYCDTKPRQDVVVRLPADSTTTTQSR